jgi:hypothetical protein
MEKMPPQNMPVQVLTVAILPLGLACFRLTTHLREILTTGKSHKKTLDYSQKTWKESWHYNLNVQPGMFEGWEKRKNN